jgi:hypothetical protein
MWYQHPDNNVYHGYYVELFALFEADEPPFGPAEILSKVATGVDAKLAFSLLSPEGKVLVLHRCPRVQPMLGAPATPNDNINIADPVAPDTDVAPVRSRKLTLIPPHLAGQILAATMAPGGLSPRQLWENIAGPLAADDQLAPQVSPFLSKRRSPPSRCCSRLWPRRGCFGRHPSGHRQTSSRSRGSC